jgi:hypothetical protein
MIAGIEEKYREYKIEEVDGIWQVSFAGRVIAETLDENSAYSVRHYHARNRHPVSKSIGYRRHLKKQ